MDQTLALHPSLPEDTQPSDEDAMRQVTLLANALHFLSPIGGDSLMENHHDITIDLLREEQSLKTGSDRELIERMSDSVAELLSPSSDPKYTTAAVLRLIGYSDSGTTFEVARNDYFSSKDEEDREGSRILTKDFLDTWNRILKINHQSALSNDGRLWWSISLGPVEKLTLEFHSRRIDAAMDSLRSKLDKLKKEAEESDNEVSKEKGELKDTEPTDNRWRWLKQLLPSSSPIRDWIQLDSWYDLSHAIYEDHPDKTLIIRLAIQFASRPRPIAFLSHVLDPNVAIYALQDIAEIIRPLVHCHRLLFGISRLREKAAKHAVPLCVVPLRITPVWGHSSSRLDEDDFEEEWSRLPTQAAARIGEKKSTLQELVANPLPVHAPAQLVSYISPTSASTLVINYVGCSTQACSLCAEFVRGSKYMFSHRMLQDTSPRWAWLSIRSGVATPLGGWGMPVAPLNPRHDRTGLERLRKFLRGRFCGTID